MMCKEAALDLPTLCTSSYHSVSVVYLYVCPIVRLIPSVGGVYLTSTVLSMLPVGERMVPITLVAIESIIYHSSDPRSLFFHFVLIDMQFNETQLHDFKR